MRERKFHLGQGAALLILLAVVTAMSLLGLLMVMNARSDLQMARRSADVAQDVAALEAAAEERIAMLDAAVMACGAEDAETFRACLAEKLPEDMTLDGDTVFWMESGADGRILECGAKIAPESENGRVQWIIHRHWAGAGGEIQ